MPVTKIMMCRIKSILFMIGLCACSATSQDIPNTGADKDALLIPETNNTQQLKNYERIKVYANKPPWTITNINVDKDDVLLIFATGKASFRKILDSPRYRLFIKIGDQLSFIIPKNPSYFSPPYAGRLKFSTGRNPKSSTPEDIDSDWYRYNSGSYRLDIFNLSKSTDMYLPAALEDIARVNRNDKLFQSQVIQFNGPAKRELSKKTTEELKYIWFGTIHYSGRNRVIEELTRRKATDVILFCFNNANRAAAELNKMDHLTFIGSLESLGDPATVEVVGKYLLDNDREIRSQALDTIGKIGDADSIAYVFPALNDINPHIRWRAVHVLGEIGNPEAIDRLSLLLADSDAMVRDSAESVLRKLGAPDKKIRDWKRKAANLAKTPLTLDEIYRAKFENPKDLSKKQEPGVQLKAENQSENKLHNLEAKKKLSVKTEGNTPSNYSDIDFGRYHALIIGNNNYRYLPELKTAQSDAREVSETLNSKYGFNVNLLLDASRSDILMALNNLRWSLTQQDNLLVYYAGHGWLDREADEGYWMPVDAQKDNMIAWISNSSVTATIRAMRAKHVLIIADSCYSGKLARGLHITNRAPGYIRRLSQKKARTVISSGGLEPVTDSGGDGLHSVFATAFLDVLRVNTDIMDGAQLFNKLRRPVMLNSDQTPEYSDIRKAGHEGGEFLFVPLGQ